MKGILIDKTNFVKPFCFSLLCLLSSYSFGIFNGAYQVINSRPHVKHECCENSISCALRAKYGV